MTRHNGSRSRKKILLKIIGLLFVCFSLYVITDDPAFKQKFDLTRADTTLIDVPLENQNDPIALGNGCEITSLSMLLNYYDYQTNKNQLADLLTYVPVHVTDEICGNPHDGFVGDITGGNEAMGVGVEPLGKVAEQIVSTDQQVIVSTEIPFESLVDIVRQGQPVVVITTTDFQVPEEENFRYWQTSSGEVKVSPLCHAVVITGVGKKEVYVNDPFGYKNRAVDRNDFATIYERMGQQALYLD